MIKLKTVFKNYHMLDGSEKQMLKQVGSGNIIRLFDKTLYPRRDMDVVCPHFMQLACVYGCPYNCAYCYLKGTFRFFQQQNGRIPLRFKKEKEVVRSLRTFLSSGLPPTILNTGELTDSLAAEAAVFYDKPFSDVSSTRLLSTP